MMHSVRLLAALLALSLVASSGAAFAEGKPVDDAKAGAKPGCYDGIGYSFTNQQEQDAQDSNDLQAFVEPHAACDPTSFDGPTLLAQCTGPTRLPQMIAATTWVVCLLHVVNPASGDAVTLNLGDLILATNDSKFSPDATASEAEASQFDLTRQPKKIVAGGDAVGIVAFQVPEEVGRGDLLLAWESAELKPADSGTKGIRLIIVHDREPSIASLLHGEGDGQASRSTTSAGQGAVQSFSGVSDDVTESIELEAGLYTIEASYQGDGNFAVIAHWGDQQKLLINNIGAYDGRVALSLTAPASVIFEVKASGTWHLHVSRAS